MKKVQTVNLLDYFCCISNLCQTRLLIGVNSEKFQKCFIKYVVSEVFFVEISIYYGYHFFTFFYSNYEIKLHRDNHSFKKVLNYPLS